MSRARRIYSPQGVRVKTDREGAPLWLGETVIESIREEWVIEDRWWTERPLRRHYYELVTVEGQNVTVFRDAGTRRWYRQSA
jgi:hypothetical protein